MTWFGQTRVDGDPVGAKLERGAACETDEPVLGGGIGRQMQRAGLGRHARDVDDPPPSALRNHLSCRPLRTKKCSGQIDLEHRIPTIKGHVDEGLHEIADPGVVDENV